MGIFVTKQRVVEAVQWNEPGDHPAVMRVGLEPDKTIYVVHAYDGVKRVNPGDWIVQDGVFLRCMPPADFKHHFVQTVERKAA